ncbi:MAG TPA: VWA domain-containing protein [Vicinamibacterales bacterium]|nr:VWA domain-containing protein [Vicinamibacterales bacterium]
MMRTSVGLAVLVLATAAPLGAQSQQQQQQPPSATFRSGTSLVALNVIVTDIKERYATDLRAEDFEVYEDGVRQPVKFFAAAEVPLDLILLIDASSSMTGKLEAVHKAANGFIETMRDGDRAAIVSFADGVKVLQALTGDRERVRAAVQSTGAQGATALHNAIYVALKEFGQPATTGPDVRRQAIAVLSDGEDTSSLLSFDDVLDLAKRSGVSIYTIGLRDDLSGRPSQSRRYFSQADFALKQLASETGAMPFFPETVQDLANVYDAIATELASQYSIGYVPRNAREDGKYRRVVVRVTDRPELTPRTRKGYFLGADTLSSGLSDQ